MARLYFELPDGEDRTTGGAVELSAANEVVAPLLADTDTPPPLPTLELNWIPGTDHVRREGEHEWISVTVCVSVLIIGLLIYKFIWAEAREYARSGR